MKVRRENEGKPWEGRAEKGLWGSQGEDKLANSPFTRTPSGKKEEGEEDWVLYHLLDGQEGGSTNLPYYSCSSYPLSDSLTYSSVYLNSVPSIRRPASSYSHNLSSSSFPTSYSCPFPFLSLISSCSLLSMIFPSVYPSDLCVSIFPRRQTYT